jgi:flagellar hook-length control protein FliK
VSLCIADDARLARRVLRINIPERKEVVYVYDIQVVPEVGQIELIGADPPNPPQTSEAEPASESFASVLGEVSAAEEAGEALPDQDEAPPSGEVLDADVEEPVEANLDAVVAVMVLFQGEVAGRPPPAVVSEATVESGVPTDAGASGQATGTNPDASPAVSQARYQVLPAAAQADAEAGGEQTGAGASETFGAASEKQGDVLEFLDIPEEAADVSVASMPKAQAIAADLDLSEIVPKAVTQPPVAPGRTEEPETAPQVAKPVQNTESAPAPQVVARTTQVVQEPQGTAIIERVTVEGLPEYTVKSVRHLVADGGTKVTVRLVPESLGEMHLEISSVRDSVVVRLVSQNPVVREALEAQLPGLRDALAREGIDIERVTVSADVGAGHQGPNSEGRQPAQFDNAPRFAGAATNGYGTGDSSTGQEARWRVPSHGGTLNLFA